MRRLKALSKFLFIVLSITFLSLSFINQKYCKPITKIVLLHAESKSFDLFAQNNIQSKEKVYNDLIVYSNSLSKTDKFEMNKAKNNLSYLDEIEKKEFTHCYLSNEIEIKSLLDSLYDRILKDKMKANVQYFPVEELQGIEKSKEYLLLLSKVMYISFLSVIILGWLIVLIKVIEIIINWRRGND